MVLTSVAGPREIVDMIAEEMAAGVERAVEFWMSQIDAVLDDRQLTSLGRLYAVQDVLERYKSSTGKAELESRVGGSASTGLVTGRGHDF